MAVQYSKLQIADRVASSASHLVGRRRELTSLWKQYEAAKSGYARVALLVGELGIGKTRLLDEFAARAVGDGAIVLRGGASDAEGMPPYLPFLEALGQYIRVAPLNRLSEQIAVTPQILASILPELTARLGEFPAPYPLLPEQTRLRLFEAIGMFLEGISTPHVLVLTLDDLHWADTSSLDLLCYIVRHHSKAKLLVVGTYREGEIDRNPVLERAVTELARLRILTKVPVAPLSADEIEALAVSYLGGPISPTLSQLLYAQSEGNPFFAEELIQGWIETEALVQGDTHWVAVVPLEHPLPQSIVGALRQRFARLSSDSIDHLRIAAIIGRTFDLSLLAAVEGQEVEAVEERLLEVERARLVRADQTGVFRFSHDKIRECLYIEVSTSRRQRLHETIGRVLEARYEKESTKSTYQLAELAFHFTHSVDRSRGATYSQLAAEQALQSSAVKEAMIHYQMALELLDADDSRRGTLLLGLGEAALLAGAESEAAVAYEAALIWLTQSGDQKAAAYAAHKLGLAQWRQEALQAAQTALEHALALLGNSVSAEAVRVLVDLSALLIIYMGQQTKGATYAQQALKMARCLENESLEAAANRAIAANLVSDNDIATSLLSLERALMLAEASGDVCEAATCSLYRMVIYYGMAEIRHSYEESLRSIKFVKRCRQQYQLCYASSWPALLLASQGAWAEAEQALEQAQAFVDNQSNVIPLAFLHQIRGFLAYQKEDYVAAEQELRAARENHQRGFGRFMFYTGLLGMTQLALGKREDASTQLDELEVLLAELPTGSLLTAPILTCLALMAITLDDQERIAKLYPRLLSFSDQHYWFLVDRILGEMATLRRDWEKAIIHLSAAEATAQREGLCPELARILVGKANFEMARGGQGSTTRARDLLNRSLVLFEELNMLASVGHVRHQISTLSHQLDNSALPSLPANLTRREVHVLQLVVVGKSNRQIAQELGISEKTVANHLSHIFSKTGSENRAAAAVFAIHHGLA